MDTLLPASEVVTDAVQHGCGEVELVVLPGRCAGGALAYLAASTLLKARG